MGASSFSSAFSLIELLVVIAIIGILSSLAVIGFGSIGRGSGARGAADLAASMTLSARIEAMAFGYGSLLLIDNSSSSDRKLQRMAVLRANKDTNGNVVYEMVGKPTSFTRGIFFLPEYSSGWRTTNTTNFPGGISTPVYYYKFSGTGYLDPDLSAADTRMVFSANIMDSSLALQNPASMVAGRRGFLLRNNGRPAFFQTTNQMPINP